MHPITITLIMVEVFASFHTYRAPVMTSIVVQVRTQEAPAYFQRNITKLAENITGEKVDW